MVQEEDPRLEIFKKPVLLVSLKANNAANRKLFTDAFNLALETGRYDLYADFLRSNLERDAVKVIKFGKFDASMYDQSPYLMRANELYQLISQSGSGNHPGTNQGEFPQVFLSMAFFRSFRSPQTFPAARWRGSRHPGRSGEGF